MTIAHVGAAHSKGLFNRLGRFAAELRAAGDYEFLLRAGPSLHAAFTPSLLANMEAGGTTNVDPRVLTETRRAKILYGARSTALAWIDFYFAYLKFLIRRIVYRIA